MKYPRLPVNESGNVRRFNATPVNFDIIQERHHAINRVIGYAELPRDEVTKDT